MGPTETLPDLTRVVHELKASGVRWVALMGSWARTEYALYRDVDLVCGAEAPPLAWPSQTALIDGHFVVLSHLTTSAEERCFDDPELATECVAGLRDGRAIWDPDRRFDLLSERARQFVWDGEIRRAGAVCAATMLVGWIEEAHKGLEGLRRNDTGRLLNAVHGLSWGLVRVVRVAEGVLVSSDNRVIEEVASAVDDARWQQLMSDAFGLTGGNLHARVRAGLALFVHTQSLLRTRYPSAFSAPTIVMLDEVCRRINEAVPQFASR